MKNVIFLLLTFLLTACANQQVTQQQTVDNLVSIECPSCYSVASHIQSIKPQPIEHILESSEAYAFRLALMQLCQSCYSALAEKEKSENTIYSEQQARLYFQSEEYAASLSEAIHTP